jgi:hypothetical protein
MLGAMRDARAQEIERLTAAEIARQIKLFRARRDALTKQLAAIFASRGLCEQPLPERERLAHESARRMLNGHAALLPPIKEGTNEEDVYVERDGCDIAIRALTSQRMERLSIDAAAWAKQHADEWREICRDWLLSAVRFEAAERRAQEFRAQEIVSFVPYYSFGIMEFVGVGSELDVRGATLEMAVKAALEEKVITPSDLKGAKDVK